MNECRVLDDVGSLERDPDEEPQRSSGVLENLYVRSVRRQMQKLAVSGDRPRNAAIFDGEDVALLGLWRNEVDAPLAGC